MSNQTIIKAGYRLTVTTWENDADNYATEILEGLTKAEVQMYVALCNVLGSGSNQKGQYGNMYEPSRNELNEAITVLRAIIEKHKAAFTSDEQYEYAYEEPLDFITTFMGSSEFATRVVDSWRVDLVPTDIVMQNCTAEFM